MVPLHYGVILRCKAPKNLLLCVRTIATAVSKKEEIPHIRSE